jgi:hypothetical protein
MRRCGSRPASRLASVGSFARWLALLGACLFLFSAGEAQAYPQFTLKGYGDCGTCHHSPTGGGLPNRWGRESLDVSFGKDWGLGFANDDLSYDAKNQTELKVDLGVDVRLLALYANDGDAAVGPTLIPMLTEIGGAAALGHWTVYGTITAKRLPAGDLPYVIASREHWLKLQLDEGVDLRVGRLVLPFGMRQPDHTQYVREDFEFDKYDQSYGAELDIRGQDWSLFGSAFAGDLTNVPSERQERGVVLTPVREFGGGAALGLSALGALSSARNRIAGSLFGRAPLVDGTYVMAEVAIQHFAQNDADATLSTLAEYLRVGWFVKPALDVFVEGGHRAFLNADGLSKGRVGLGLNWQLTRWFEFAPQLLAEARSGLPNRVLGLAQLHLIY